MNNVIQNKATDITRVNLPATEVDKIALETKPVRRELSELSKVRVEESNNLSDLIQRIGVEVTPVKPAISQSLMQRIQLNVPGIETIAKATMTVVRTTTQLATSLMISVFRQVKASEYQEAQVEQTRSDEREQEKIVAERREYQVVANVTPESQTVETVNGGGQVVGIRTIKHEPAAVRTIDDQRTR